MFNYDCVVPTQIHKSVQYNYILYGCGLAFCRPHALRQSRVRVSTPRLNGHGLEKLEMDDCMQFEMNLLNLGKLTNNHSATNMWSTK
jgi:hypothetical protein